MVIEEINYAATLIYIAVCIDWNYEITILLIKQIKQGLEDN